MKAITIRPTQMINPAYSEEDRAKAEKQDLPYRVSPILETDSGRVTEERGCWRLVHMGLAVPLDDECREAAGMTEEQVVKAIAAYELTEQGRTTGRPDADAPRKASSVQLPDDWSHLADAINEEIEKRQDRIDQLHSQAKQEEAEEKAEGQIMYVVNADDLPPEEDDLPPE